MDYSIHCFLKVLVDFGGLNFETFNKEIDGSAHKPVLMQDTEYLVEKTYHIAPFLGTFGAYLKPQ